MERSNNIVFTGPAGSGKTSKLFEQLISTARKSTFSCQTLILLPDSVRCNEWRKKTAGFTPFQPEVQSYNSFVKNELVLYYPFVLKRCRDIKTKDMQPLFLNNNAARFLLYKVIEKKRETEFLFSPVVCDSMKIASELSYGQTRAARHGIPFEETGVRLKAAYRPEDRIKDKIYNDSDAILTAFRTKCLEVGAFDQSLSLYLYNEYLLADKRYIASLHKRYGCIIADDLEQFQPVALKLIRRLIEGTQSAAFSFNPEAAEAGEGAGLEILDREILKFCNVNKLEGSFTCNRDMYELSSALRAAIAETEGRMPCKTAHVEMVTAFELRSEMLEAAGEKIAALVREGGIKPSEIAVLSTFADPVTGYYLGNILKDRGVLLKNISTGKKASESTAIRSLLALARLCFPMFRLYPGKDNMRVLVKKLFNIDPVSVSIISELILNQKPYPFIPDWDVAVNALQSDVIDREKYEYVKLWCESWRDRSPELPEFFRMAFLEVLGFDIHLKDEIDEVKQLADESASFVNAVSKFMRYPEKDFLDFMGSGTTVFLKTGIPEIPDGFVSFMTASTAFSIKASFRVIVILSASSRNWLPFPGGGVVNNPSLSAGGGTADILTSDKDCTERRLILASKMGCILKKCRDRLIVYESDYSINGYENDGILSSCIIEAVGGL